VGWWVAIVALAGCYGLAVRRSGLGRARVASFLGGLALLALAVTWPVGDLAAHWALVALVVQRLLLLLAVAPLLLLGLPPGQVARWSRPAPVDAVLRTCSRPAPAVVVVTAVAVGTLTTGAVAAQAASELAAAGLELLLLLAGVVLWLPILDLVPGTHHLSAGAKAAYLFVQSIVPGFLSVVWIFARHPLYPTYAHAPRVLGLSALTDQQLAGFLAKLATIATLWTVAFVVLSRAQRRGSLERDEGASLTWDDVQRELERADRVRRRHAPAPPGPGGDEPEA
jgi:cytochrome c oxidase assembly factor CtaG